MNIATRTIIAASLAVGLATAASAVTITPVSAVASSAYAGYGANFAIDGNPLTDWAANSTGVGTSIFFDLGASYALTGASITDRVTSGGGNGSFTGWTVDFTTSYQIDFYSDAAGTLLVGSYTSPTLSAPGSPTVPADFLNSPVFSVTARSARYTILAINSDQYNNPGLSEITFDSAVPDAPAWVLMIAGFGMVGAAARNRKRAVAA